MVDWQTEIAARTVYAEASNQGSEGMQAVAHVLVNRMLSGKWGSTLGEVCLYAAQFSCWNAYLSGKGPKPINNPDRMRVAKAPDTDPILVECRAHVQAALDGEPDPVKGAMFYERVGVNAPWRAGKTPIVTIGAHEFFDNID